MFSESRKNLPDETFLSSGRDFIGFAFAPPDTAVQTGRFRLLYSVNDTPLGGGVFLVADTVDRTGV